MESREQNYGISAEAEAAGHEPAGPRVVEEDHTGQDGAGYSAIEDEAAGHRAAAPGPAGGRRITPGRTGRATAPSRTRPPGTGPSPWGRGRRGRGRCSRT